MNSGDTSTICLDNLAIVESGNMYIDGGFESGTLTKNNYWSDNGYYDDLLVGKTDDPDAVYEGDYAPQVHERRRLARPRAVPHRPGAQHHLPRFLHV